MKFCFKTNCVNYSDLSSDNDLHLQLISSLLLNANDSLDAKESKSLGLYLNGYLNRKIVLDCYFWQRSAEICKLDDEEFEGQIQEIKNKIMS